MNHRTNTTDDPDGIRFFDFDDDFRSRVGEYLRAAAHGSSPAEEDLAEELYSRYLNPAVMPMLAELQYVSPRTADIVATALAYLLMDVQSGWEELRVPCP